MQEDKSKMDAETFIRLLLMDVQTPIMTIKGFAQLSKTVLDSGEYPPELQEYNQRILEAVETLDNILKQVSPPSANVDEG